MFCDGGHGGRGVQEDGSAISHVSDYSIEKREARTSVESDGVSNNLVENEFIREQVTGLNRKPTSSTYLSFKAALYGRFRSMLPPPLQKARGRICSTCATIVPFTKQVPNSRCDTRVGLSAFPDRARNQATSASSGDGEVL